MGKESLFKLSDIITGPICFVILLMIMSVVLTGYNHDEKIKRLFLRAFYFKMFCTLAYTAVNSFYYRGGDTEMYYHCTQFLHNAVTDDVDNFGKIYATKVINVKTDLMNYFIYTESRYPVFEAMHDPFIMAVEQYTNCKKEIVHEKIFMYIPVQG